MSLRNSRSAQVKLASLYLPGKYQDRTLPILQAEHFSKGFGSRRKLLSGGAEVIKK
jgi:hypothetical protein